MARTQETDPSGPVLVERMTRFELATSTLARWRSSQLSYIRTSQALTSRGSAATAYNDEA